MTDLVTEICNDIGERLEGSGLTYALILWKPGSAASPDGVAIQTPARHEREVSTAARTVADCVDKALMQRARQ